MVIAFLTKAGYTVLEAGNGADALQAAAQHHQTIDLLLTDTIMPGMNGRVLAQALKQLQPLDVSSGSTCPATPVMTEWFFNRPAEIG